MCFIISFWEIFPAGSWISGGWIGGLPDGRGIRHYNEFMVCNGKEIHDFAERVVPNSGYLQIESIVNCEDLNDPSGADIRFENEEDHTDNTKIAEDTWQEYELTGTPLTFICTRLGINHTMTITTKPKEKEDEDPHKYIDGTLYRFCVEEITVI